MNTHLGRSLTKIISESLRCCKEQECRGADIQRQASDIQGYAPDRSRWHARGV